MTLAGDVSGLHRMPRVALSDRHADQHPRRADLMRPHRLHIGHAGFDDVLSEQRRARHRAVPRELVGRPERRAAEDDRIVAMVDRLNVEHWLRPYIAGVVAGPLAERPL